MTKKKRERILRDMDWPVWRPFNAFDIDWAKKHEGIKEVYRLIKTDIRYMKQRLLRGYCDADAMSISKWFMATVPAMLQQYKKERISSPGRLGENYTNEKGFLVNDTCHSEWDGILDEMIFYFLEANEEGCQKKNPYETEHERIQQEFFDKYGLFGEALQTEEERNSKTGMRMHFADELPEYADIEKKYREEEKKLVAYRMECKDKAFELFSKWFWDLYS